MTFDAYGPEVAVTEAPITVRQANEADDLTDLFPESVNNPLNREQVLVATDGTRLVGGTILWDGGHSVLYVGATRILGQDRRVWIARALWRAVIDWGKERGAVEVLHAAGTRECSEAFQRLGARVVRPNDVVLGIRLDKAEAPRGPVSSGEGSKVTLPASDVRLRFVSPFDKAELDALKTLMVRAGGPVQPNPLWWHMVTSLGAWHADTLIGYVQFSIGLGTTFEYGLRLDYQYRGSGLGRRLFAAWLALTRQMGATYALSAIVPGNKPMERLLEMAGFQPQGTIAGIPQDQMLYAGDERAFKWAQAEPAEAEVPWP